VPGQLGDADGSHGRRGRGRWRGVCRGAWSLAALLLSVNASCSGYRPVPAFDPGPLPEPTAVPGTPLTRLWRAQPVKGPSAPIALDSANAYLGGSDRRVVSVDLASGKTRWARRVRGPLVGGVLRAGNVVFAGTDHPGGTVYAFLAASGSELWSTRTGAVEAPLTLANGRLIVLNRQHQVLAMDTATGKVLWRRPLPSQQIAPLPLGDDHVLVSSHDSLYVVQVSDGKVTLRVRTPGALASSWVRVGKSLVATTGDSLVVALDPDSLRLQWRAHLSGPLLTPPALSGDTLYCVTQFGSLHRIVLGNGPAVTRLGADHWAATGAPALIGGWILIGGSDGALRAFRPEDGAEGWSTTLGRPFELAPLLLGEREFLAVGGRGDVHRMRL